MILVIDNYDSFTYNLVQYIGETGRKIAVYRNDCLNVEQVRKLRPQKIVISPGPCTPKEAGVSNDVIRNFSGKIPILGVCLGHQCIGYCFGARVVRAPRLMHGKTSLIRHNGKTVFSAVENPFPATRYHSLIVERKGLPRCLEITAETDKKEIMGIRHRKFPVWGVQFHPESILTGEGRKILRNFLEM